MFLKFETKSGAEGGSVRNELSFSSPPLKIDKNYIVTLCSGISRVFNPRDIIELWGQPDWEPEQKKKKNSGGIYYLHDVVVVVIVFEFRKKKLGKIFF